MDTRQIPLSRQDLRDVTAYAAECAQEVLPVFENAQPGDSRPRDAIDTAWAFARGGERGKALRGAAWAALGGRVGELLRDLDRALRSGT